MTEVMDKECINLCRALNRLEGITTIDSCCGHGKHNYHIFFIAKNLEYLPPLLYYFDSCHCGFGGWRVIAKTDCGMSPVYFMIEGPSGGYSEADHIAELINAWIDSPENMEVGND